ncbi:MAG: DUF4390 domain-containing protein [Steroidobacter sp.]
MAASPTWRDALCPGGPDTVRRPAAWLFAAALVLLNCAFGADASAETHFEVRSAYIEPAERVYELNATLNFDLPEGAREVIREGVPLTMHLEIVVKRQRSYWLDETVATLDQSYELAYRALSERYLVRNLNSGEQASYATLDAALDAMRVISRLPILDQALVTQNRRHEISIRGNLDVRTMPDALRFVLFWSDDWRQRSEWYTWSPQL